MYGNKWKEKHEQQYCTDFCFSGLHTFFCSKEQTKCIVLHGMGRRRRGVGPLTEVLSVSVFKTLANSVLVALLLLNFLLLKRKRENVLVASLNVTWFNVIQF
ncbi:hypothetical protein FKM82_001789 [Ascaphus truei]